MEDSALEMELPAGTRKTRNAFCACTMKILLNPNKIKRPAY